MPSLSRCRALWALAGLAVMMAPLAARAATPCADSNVAVFYEVPVLPGDPILSAPNTVLSPHLGYASSENLADFYRYSIENLTAWLDGAPIRTVNPEILT